MSGNRWATDPRGPYRRTVSGRRFHFLDVRPEDLYIPDAIYHLSRTIRFGGCGISVAQHCVVAAEMAARFYPQDPMLPARMLIHDLIEYGFGDLSSPLKSLLPDYKRMETDAELAVEDLFDLSFIGNELVKEVDDRMYLTERLKVFPDIPVEEDYTGPLEPFPLTLGEFEDRFYRWSTHKAECAFNNDLVEYFPAVDWDWDGDEEAGSASTH